MKKVFVISSIAGLFLGYSSLYALNFSTSNSPDGCINKMSPAIYVYTLFSPDQVKKFSSNYSPDAKIAFDKKMYALTDVVVEDQKNIIRAMTTSTTIDAAHPNEALNKAIAQWQKDSGDLIKAEATVVSYTYNHVATPMQKKTIANELIMYFGNVGNCRHSEFQPYIDSNKTT